MLRYRLITGPILFVLLLAVVTLDNWVDSLQLHGVWQDLFRGKELPPRGLVATRRAKRRDVKKVTEGAEEQCVGENRDMCGELRLFGFLPGPHRFHPHLAYKYAHYK